MQIVIELSELDYKWITLRKGDETLYPLTLTIYEAIKNGKPLEQEPLEVEAAQLQKAYNKGFEDCRQAAVNKLKEGGKWGTDYYEWTDAVKDIETLRATGK